jgi:hypothetical protein
MARSQGDQMFFCEKNAQRPRKMAQEVAQLFFAIFNSFKQDDAVLSVFYDYIKWHLV